MQTPWQMEILAISTDKSHEKFFVRKGTIGTSQSERNDSTAIPSNDVEPMASIPSTTAKHLSQF
jgi:hypothetical protein